MLERHQIKRDISTLTRVTRTTILGLAYLLRLGGLTAQGMWRDEVDQWRFALLPLGEILQNFSRPGWNGPLYSPLLRIWIALVGDSVFALRYFSLLWGLMSVALLYGLARRLFDEGTALWSALLLALSPYMVWYAQEVKMYSWVPMLALLALYTLDRACVRPTWYRWLTVLLATMFAFYSHLLAALLIAVEVLWFWLHPRRHERAWCGALIIGLLLSVPYLPLLRWVLPLLSHERETGFPAYSLGQMLGILFSGWTAGMAQSYILEPVLVYIKIWAAILVLVGVGGLLCQRCVRRLWQLCLWLLVPLLVIWLLSLRGPIFTDRYLIWTAPAFYLLAAKGLTAFSRFRRRLALILVWHVLFSNAIGLYHQVVYPLKPQFHLATSFLETARTADELLLFQIPYNHYVMEYYARRPLDPWAEAPFTNWKSDDGRYLVDMSYVDKELTALLGNARGVWLVYSEVTMWDERQLVKQWLDTHAQMIDERVYFGVGLYHYVR